MGIIVNAYSTLREPPELDFDHQSLGFRSRSDAELLSHLHGFMGFVCESGKREMTPTLYAVMRHIERVHHHYSFEIAEERLDQMANWGWQSNSIFFLPDGTVRDPAGAVLVDPETGAAQPQASIPFPQDALDRARHSEQQLASLGIHCTVDLPPVFGEGEVVLRTPDEVAWRTLALLIVAVRAESLASAKPIPVSQLRAKSPMAFEAMSPAETAFLNDEHPSEQAIVEAAWRYEALYAMQWAMGLYDELRFPDEICDVPAVAETMLRRTNRELVNDATLRNVTEILDALDRNGRMLWAARQARMEGRNTPAGLDGGVLSERQHALNWLVRFGDAPWDDVDTPT